MKLFPVILGLLVYYDCNVTNSNYMLIQFDAQSHNHIVKPNTSKLKAKELFNSIGRKLISDFDKNPMNKRCKCSRKGECKAKGCKFRRSKSRSIAGLFRQAFKLLRFSLLFPIRYAKLKQIIH